MAGPAFDPHGAVRFDLRNGAASDSKGARLLVVPAAALAGLGADALEHIGAELGRACGQRVAARLGGEAGVRGTQLEIVVSHLAGELAVAGAFAMHVERWGRALVAVVENPSLADESFVAAAIGAAMTAVSGKAASAVNLGNEGARWRYFVGSPVTVERVRDMVGQGKGYADVLASIQGGAS